MNHTADSAVGSVSGDVLAAVLGALVGASIAGLVAWLIHRSSSEQTKELIRAQMQHQAQISFYQVEWPWYREVLHHVATINRGVSHVLAGTQTHEINQQTLASLTFLHAASEVFARTNVLAAHAVRDIVHAAHEVLKPGARTQEERSTAAKAFDEIPKRLSRILVKSAGMDPELFVEELKAEGHLDPKPVRK